MYEGVYNMLEVGDWSLRCGFGLFRRCHESAMLPKGLRKKAIRLLGKCYVAKLLSWAPYPSAGVSSFHCGCSAQNPNSFSKTP